MSDPKLELPYDPVADEVAERYVNSRLAMLHEGACIPRFYQNDPAKMAAAKIATPGAMHMFTQEDARALARCL